MESTGMEKWWCDLVMCDLNDGEEELLKLESGVWEGRGGV